MSSSRLVHLVADLLDREQIVTTPTIDALLGPPDLQIPSKPHAQVFCPNFPKGFIKGWISLKWTLHVMRWKRSSSPSRSRLKKFGVPLPRPGLRESQLRLVPRPVPRWRSERDPAGYAAAMRLPEDLPVPGLAYGLGCVFQAARTLSDHDRGMCDRRPSGLSDNSLRTRGRCDGLTERGWRTGRAATYPGSPGPLIVQHTWACQSWQHRNSTFSGAVCCNNPQERAIPWSVTRTAEADRVPAPHRPAYRRKSPVLPAGSGRAQASHRCASMRCIGWELPR